MISGSIHKELKSHKNLLAFSAGVDSTALFYLLIEADIEFDIALVNYGVRANSKSEAMHAETLGKRHGKRVYIHNAPAIKSDFEHKAREVRYTFFQKLIQTYDYYNLITAHQLNDRLEWLVMQLSKGAGLAEIVGMREVEGRDSYRIIRPLLNSPKSELKEYLESSGYIYFIDESNSNTSYKRNHFRYKYTDELLNENIGGFRKSFELLHADSELLIEPVKLQKLKKLTWFKRATNMRSTMFHIDKVLKKDGYICSAAQRGEIENRLSVVVADRFSVAITENIVYIAPYAKESMPKKFKEACRVAKIPPLIRGYLYLASLKPSSFSSDSA